MGVKRRYFEEIQRRPFGRNVNFLKSSIKDSAELLGRMELQDQLTIHNGCVNTIAWNERGSLLLSGSDDHKLVISDPFNYIHNTINTPHTANIFSAKFLSGSGDSKLVSCDGDGVIVTLDCNRPDSPSVLRCHTGTVYELLAVPGVPHSFLSCGEDGTVRFFDTRVHSSCSSKDCFQDVIINCDCGVSSISVNPIFSYELAVGGSDSCVRLYDKRMLSSHLSSCDKNTGLSGLVSKFTVPELKGKSRRITSVNFRPDGQEVLASYSSDYLYIFNPKDNVSKKGKRLKVGIPSARNMSTSSSSNHHHTSSTHQPIKKLRLRGDWSDTGPNSRPEVEANSSVFQRDGSRPQSGTGEGSEASSSGTSGQAALMQRMTYALSRMLNDPGTRLAMHRLNMSREASSAPTARRRSDQEIVSEIRDSMNLGPAETATTSNTEETTSTSNREPSPTTGPTQHSVGNDSPIDGAAALSDASPSRSSSQGETSRTCLDQETRRSAARAIQESWRRYRESKARAQTHNSTNSSVSSGGRQSQSSNPDNQHPTQTGDRQSNLENLESSYSNLLDAGVEPTLQFRYGVEGTTSSSIEINTNMLPGPSRVVTGPGRVGVDPVTGVRRRRPGVSSIPTSSILPEQHQSGSSSGSASGATPIQSPEDSVVEYESDYCDMEDESDELYGRTILQPPVIQKFTGHRNVRTMIKEACWWGNNYVLSGSDCGHFFGWDRETANVVMMKLADRHVVNCLQPHPDLPILATSGIDHDVKIWSTTDSEYNLDKDMVDVVVRRNEVMLEETRDTITVPASLMIRMLASLNQIRRGQGAAPSESAE